MCETGLYAGNYFDYVDDQLALEREYDIGESLIDGQNFYDSSFPPDPRSLYFDPFNPPKGSLPGSSIKWCSIIEREVLDCETPVTFKGTQSSSTVIQGSLGNGYFVNALRLLSCREEYVRRLIVSEKYASKGMYTLKFCKAGKWRYVHIDDRIACRPSGRVNYCRNEDVDEVWAMLMEKAYAKLHGCYEALVFGLIEKVLVDCIPAGHVRTIRSEELTEDTACDIVWEALESAVEGRKLSGCGRFVSDPYGETLEDRKGVTINHVYEVIDAVAASADATETYDALTVGMVCIRNLQGQGQGRFVGKWSYGDQLWADYPEIGKFLQKRSEDLMKGLGLEVRPITLTPEMNYIKQQHRGVMPKQPDVEDLYWIQIEDFVEVFNRVYIVNDISDLVPPAGTPAAVVAVTPKPTTSIKRKKDEEIVKVQSTHRIAAQWIPGIQLYSLPPLSQQWYTSQIQAGVH